MVQVFNNELYHDATFAHLQSHPKILLNSTVHNDHTRFTFTDESFDRLHSVLAPYPVANAVNASSAFPGAFQDVTLEWYITPRQYMTQGGPTARFRAFAGYAGWGPGQLGFEMLQGSWAVLSGESNLFDKDPAALWQDSIARLQAPRVISW